MTDHPYAGKSSLQSAGRVTRKVFGSPDRCCLKTCGAIARGSAGYIENRNVRFYFCEHHAKNPAIRESTNWHSLDEENK